MHFLLGKVICISNSYSTFKTYVKSYNFHKDFRKYSLMDIALPSSRPSISCIFYMTHLDTIIFCRMLFCNCSMSLLLPHPLDSEIFKGKKHNLHFFNHFEKCLPSAVLDIYQVLNRVFLNESTIKIFKPVMEYAQTSII